MTVVRCENVSKAYTPNAVLGIKELLVGKNRKVGRFTREWALRDISFAVNRGEGFGVIGLNGSGKSTLLGLILGVLKPDRGTVAVDGRIAALLELGAGFHPELTGRQNVFLYGSILGMSIREIRERFERIVEFSELAEAIENPLRTYSSGMITRLGFATIIHAPADILLIDEVLAVGDASFQKKCKEFLLKFRSGGGTLVIVSHDLVSIRSLCDHAICLNEGRILNQGETEQVVATYEEWVRRGHPSAGNLAVTADA